MLLQGTVFQPPGILRETEAVTGNRTLTAGDNGILLNVTSGSGTIIADAATLGAGYKFAIYNDGSGSPVFDPTSTQTIRLPSGTVSTYTFIQGQGLTLVSNGTNWIAALGIGFGPAPSAAVSVYDNTFSILDNVNPTKIAQFQCSGISASTTRTFTFLDANVILAGSASALTSGRIPVVTTGGLLTDNSNFQFGSGAVYDRECKIVGTGSAGWSTNDGTRTWVFGSNSGTFQLYDATGASSKVLVTNTTFTFQSGLSTGVSFACNVSQTGATTFGTGTGAVSLNGAVTAASTLAVDSTADATSPTTGSAQTDGGLGVVKNIIGGQGLGLGVTSTATAATTTTLTNASDFHQIFTGTTTQTVQLPAANLFGAGTAVCFLIASSSTGDVTIQRAGSDTFLDGTTSVVLTGSTYSSLWFISNGVSVWTVK